MKYGTNKSHVSQLSEATYACHEKMNKLHEPCLTNHMTRSTHLGCEAYGPGGATWFLVCPDVCVQK